MTRPADKDARVAESLSREERLAAALRENLRRRKAQAQQRGAAVETKDKDRKPR